MKKVTNKKGFTLAELLIVIAIISVLVAVLFPVFGNSMTRAKVTADAANVRAYIAEECADQMASSSFTGVITINKANIQSQVKNGSVLTYGTEKITVSDKATSPTCSMDVPVDKDIVFTDGTN